MNRISVGIVRYVHNQCGHWLESKQFSYNYEKYIVIVIWCVYEFNDYVKCKVLKQFCMYLTQKGHYDNSFLFLDAL